MKLLGLYLLVSALIGYLVGKDAYGRDNEVTTSLALGVFFGLTWPFTILLWLFEKQDSDD